MSITNIKLLNGIEAQITVVQSVIELNGIPIPIQSGGDSFPGGTEVGQVPRWSGALWLPTLLQTGDILGLQDIIPNSLVDLDTTVTGSELNADHAKLETIESGAKDDQTGSEIKALYEAELNTNVFTDSEKNALAAVQTDLDNHKTGENVHNVSAITGLHSVATSGNYTELINKPAVPSILVDLDTVVSGSELNSDHNKLIGIEDNATADQNSAEIKFLYESEPNTNAFTDSEKNKLSSLESSKFLGAYPDFNSLLVAHPSPAVGSYGYVDTGIGQDTQSFIWDENDSRFVLQLGEATAETPASIKTKYESNLNTNSLTDSEKNSLSYLSFTENSGELRGSSIASGTLTLSSTNDATKGSINIGTIAEFDEFLATYALGTTPAFDTKSTIRGLDNTSETYTAKFENSDGTDLLSVRDDGRVEFRNYNFPIADGTVNQFMQTDGAGAIKFATATASNISDFDTEVSNNTDVSSNTTHRTSDGSDHSGVALLAGRTGGQTLNGGNATGNDLTLNSNALKDGQINLGTMATFIEAYTHLVVGSNSFITPYSTYVLQGNPTIQVRQSTATSEATPYAASIFSNNQTNLSGNVAQIAFMNEAAASDDKRIAYILSQTNGSLNSGSLMFTTYLSGVANLNQLFLKSNGYTALGHNNPTARVHAKGSGNTSATYTAKFENSDGTNLLLCRDDGQLYHDGPIASSELEKNADYTINKSDPDTIIFSPTEENQVLTMPADPESGDKRTIICPDSALHSFTLAGNGTNILGQANQIITPNTTLNLRKTENYGWQ